MKLEIRRMSTGGQGIGFYQKKPVFVDGLFPSEIAEVDLIPEKGHFRGEIKKILKKSPVRIRPACYHTEKCGSCSLMALDYRKQLEIKKDILKECLERYCGYREEIKDVIPSPDILHYRNKCSMPVVDRHGEMVNAFYASASNRPALIENCPVHAEEIEKIRKQVMAVLNAEGYHAYQRKEKSGIRQIVLRGFAEEYQLVIVTGNDRLREETVKKLSSIPHLVSIFQGINTQRDPHEIVPDELKRLFGKEKITWKMGDFDVLLSPQAFFQLNEKQALRIYSDVKKRIDGKKKNIIEAYSGIGVISLFLSEKAEKITGIEIVKEAVKDAAENAERNGLKHLRFVCQDASEGVKKLLKTQKADLLVVDPPRTGLDEKLLKTLVNSSIEQIIYISCNPITLAKDLSVLTEKYRLDEIQPYDMFPQTAHVECVALFKRI